MDVDYSLKIKKTLITILQRCFINAYGAKIMIDGDFGPETKAACRAVIQGRQGTSCQYLSGRAYGQRHYLQED